MAAAEYPKGKTGRLPMGGRSMRLPGKGDVVKDKGIAPDMPNSAARKGDSMGAVVPGAGRPGTSDFVRG